MYVIKGLTARISSNEQMILDYFNDFEDNSQSSAYYYMARDVDDKHLWLK